MTAKRTKKIKVLFVDPIAERGKARTESASYQQTGWDTTLAQTGEKALGAIAQKPFDIVVSELQLPQMDGSLFLANVKRESPNSIRILIHDASEGLRLRKGTGLAHRYIEAPESEEVLLAVIVQVLKTQLRIRKRAVADLIRSTKQLHVNTSAMQELLQSADDPECDIEDLAPIIMKHPTAVATILQVSNTAIFGAGGRIETVEEAIHMLGMDFVRNLAITELTKKQLNLSPSLQEIANAVLMHSIETSQCGFQLKKFGVSAKLTQALSSLCLLHDLGKLVLLANKGHEYADIMGRSIENDRPIWRLEQATLGTDHAAVGAYLFAMWGLPETIIRAVAWHHEPQGMVENKFCHVSLLHFSNAAAHSQHEMKFYRGDDFAPEVVERVGMPADFLKQLS